MREKETSKAAIVGAGECVHVHVVAQLPEFDGIENVKGSALIGEVLRSPRRRRGQGST